MAWQDSSHIWYRRLAFGTHTSPSLCDAQHSQQGDSDNYTIGSTDLDYFS